MIKIYELIKMGQMLKTSINKELKKYDLTFTQWSVLKEIRKTKEQKIRASELIKNLNSDKATISAVVKKLEEKKYLKCVKNPKDLREVNIELTSKTEEICHQILESEKEVILKIKKNNQLVSKVLKLIENEGDINES